MRAETGPMEFENDWCGIFIRGDNAAYFAYLLDAILDNVESDDRTTIDPISVTVLRGLVDILKESDHLSNAEVQNMRPFEECSKEALADSIINR